MTVRWHWMPDNPGESLVMSYPIHDSRRETVTDDLAAWLLEQIAEDERAAREVSSPAPWVVDDQQRDDRAIYGAARGATVAYDPSGDEESRRDFAHIVRWDPARVLAECDAKRRIVERHSHTTEVIWRDRSQDFEVCDECGSGAANQGCTPWPCDTLKLLALSNADRPGYREEWRP